jgi:D-amino-acid dehydrogenase
VAGPGGCPLLFRVRADLRQWLWGLQFLRNCTPARTRHNIQQIVRLGTYSRAALQQLRRDTGIEYDQRTQGILHFYTNQKEFDGALGPAEQMRQLGCERQVISADEAVRIEPALAHIRPQLAGATFTAEDESGDANLFVARTGQTVRGRPACSSAWAQHITALREVGGSIDHVELTNAEGRFERVRGDAFVLAMGSFSPLLAQPLGMSPAHLPGQGLFGDHAGEGREPWRTR